MKAETEGLLKASVWQGKLNSDEASTDAVAAVRFTTLLCMLLAFAAAPAPRQTLPSSIIEASSMGSGITKCRPPLRRCRRAWPVRGACLTPFCGLRVAGQVRGMLCECNSRIIDLFRTWDNDGSGTVSRVEFHNAIKFLGLKCGRVEVDAIFDEMDTDRSGELSLREINRDLRRGASGDVAMIIPSAIKMAAEPIETSAKNTHAQRKDKANRGRRTAKVCSCAGNIACLHMRPLHAVPLRSARVHIRMRACCVRCS